MGAKRIEKLKAQIAPLHPRDSMAAAGRKLLLVDFVKMLEHESGSRTGVDIEDVHDMRVAIRRLRSALHLLEPYLSADAKAYRRQFRAVARALGAVRDLDVMIDDLARYQAAQTAGRSDLQSVIEILDMKRQTARHKLVMMLDAKPYRSLIKAFSSFLLADPQKDQPPAPSAAPYQVRHLLPTMIYAQLGHVRAFDEVLPGADDETLHTLRIEFKKLRYTVSFFSGVLGKTAADFITELKRIQDHLGRLNDIHVARAHFEAVSGWDKAAEAALQSYLALLEAEAPDLRQAFTALWTDFNSRKVQRKLSDAVLALR